MFHQSSDDEKRKFSQYLQTIRFFHHLETQCKKHKNGSVRYKPTENDHQNKK